MYLRGTVIGKKISGIEIVGTVGDTNTSAYGISVITNSKVTGSSSGIYIDGNVGDTSTYGIYVNGTVKGSDSGIYLNGTVGDANNTKYGIY